MYQQCTRCTASPLRLTQQADTAQSVSLHGLRVRAQHGGPFRIQSACAAWTVASYTTKHQRGRTGLITHGLGAPVVTGDPQTATKPSAGVHQANVWPSTELPALKPALQGLGVTMCRVATHILRACERILIADEPTELAGGMQPVATGSIAAPERRSSQSTQHRSAEHAAAGSPSPSSHQRGGAGSGSGDRGAIGEQLPCAQRICASLAPPIQTQRANKARLLHYYPVLDGGGVSDAWCGWHFDHGTLTGAHHSGLMFWACTSGECLAPLLRSTAATLHLHDSIFS
jgi:hypothetical protein